MEKRLAVLGDNERELDDMVLRDAEAFLDTKIALEESIKVVSDQIQYLDSVQQVIEKGQFCCTHLHVQSTP